MDKIKSGQKLKYFGLTDKGLVRKNNEDAFVVRPDLGLFIISDGMGGEFAGDLASKIVVESLPLQFEKIISGPLDLSSPEVQKKIICELSYLSNGLRDQAKDQPGLDGMGATVVAALVRKNKMVIVHMGDSRAYLLRNGEFTQLTKDHSIVQLLLDAGEISPEAAVEHPAKGQITRYVGMEGNPLPELKYLKFENNDRILFCTDGLNGMLPAGMIRQIMASGRNPRQICRKLVAEANNAGGQDNITAIALFFEEE